MSASPLPVVLVTGFLGGGKTTLLRRWAESAGESRLMFLVNELADQDVDAARLRAHAPSARSVVGGSIFCECKAADFLRMLRDEVLPARRAGEVDLLVVETSGIADPGAIGTLIDRAGFGEELEVISIVTVIAPGKFLKLSRGLPVVRAQVEAADWVLLNKTDLYGEEDLAACEARVREFQPAAQILRTVYGEGCPLDILHRNRPLPQGVPGRCDAVAFLALRIQPRSFADMDALRQTLEALPESVRRVKGCVRVAGTLVEVDTSADGTDLRPAESAAELELVLIGDKPRVNELQESADRLRVRRALLACDVFREELEAMTDLPDFVHTVWLPMGLHDRPADLRGQVQSEIHRLEADAAVDEILLLYALCGGGVRELTSQRCPLIVPRAHDCIAVLLGSNEKHQALQKACPGTYFFAPGWIRERRVPGPDRETWLRALYADRYDEDMIEELVEVDRESFSHYEKALFIRTPAAGETENYCQRCAAHLGWVMQREESDPAWLRALLHGPHPADRFLTVPPGHRIHATADAEILRAGPP